MPLKNKSPRTTVSVFSHSSKSRGFKRLPFFLLCLLTAFLLTACGPSEEKIALAQQKYAELTELHNQVVDAHSQVKDSSLDASLTALSEETAALKDYNLQEMSEEEIDLLLQDMDSLIAAYKENQEMLLAMKEAEDAAVLTPISLTLINDSSLSFYGLSLYEEGSRSTSENVFENMSPLSPGQSLTGLVIQRDVDQTPWILSLTTTEDASYEIQLPVADYPTDGVILHIIYDSETDTILLENT